MKINERVATGTMIAAGVAMIVACLGCNCKHVALKNALKLKQEGKEARVIVYDVTWSDRISTMGFYWGHAEAQTKMDGKWQWVDEAGVKDMSDYQPKGEIVRTYAPDEFRKFLNGDDHEYEMLICDEWVRVRTPEARRECERLGDKIGKWSQERACREKYGEDWELLRRPALGNMNFRPGFLLH